MSKLISLIAEGDRLLASGDAEALSALLPQAQSAADRGDESELELLREAVTRWVPQALMLRAESLAALKKLTGAGDAVRTYRAVSDAG